MANTLAKEKQRLRKHLNSTIKGNNVDKVLESLAPGTLHLIDSVEQVTDQLYITTANGRYLDQRLADKGVSRPENVGLSDDIYREIGIEITNRKQVRDLLSKLLEIMYGAEYTRATSNSTMYEPYSLADGDSLLLYFDDVDEEIEIIFNSSQFASIAAATAQEVADVITRNISRLGKTGSALAVDDGSGYYVTLISNTNGTASSIKVSGGKAQNKLKFPTIRPTTGDISTQWTLSLVSGSKIRMTWTGGANPSVGKVRKNDYVNIYGSAFDADNRGRFFITEVKGGLIGTSYVEFENPIGVAETVVQGTVDGVLFFNPTRVGLVNKSQYAALFQTESRILEVVIPATTKVVRRDRIGSAHIQDSGFSIDEQYGPYIFDLDKPYVIGGEECNTTMVVDASTTSLVQVDDSTDIPDEQGLLVFGFGTSKEEGPVPYISRPSSNLIALNPSYKFTNVHAAGTNISLIASNQAVELDTDGTDYGFYLTDVTSGRLYVEELIQDLSATGITLVITVLYSGDIGLGKWGTDQSEIYAIWE